MSDDGIETTATVLQKYLTFLDASMPMAVALLFAFYCCFGLQKNWSIFLREGSGYEKGLIVKPFGLQKN